MKSTNLARAVESPAAELRKAKDQPRTACGTPSAFEAVTAADVLRVAKQYMEPNQRAVATLIPEAAK